MGEWPLRDRVCVVGVGTTRYGSFPETDALGLGAEALRTAVADAGVRFEDIDELIVCRIPHERFVQAIGLQPRICTQVWAPGRFAAISLMKAADAIASGQSDVVALVYGNNGHSARVRYGGEDNPWSPNFWAPWGMTSPGAIRALMFRRYMHEFGTRADDLADVAIAFRRHASRNPQAVMRTLVSREDYLSARFICEPLRLLDYCVVADGGVAFILTSAERARDMAKRGVYISGFARQFSSDSTPAMTFWYPELQRVASEVYEGAGLAQDEMSGLMIYDNFSPTVLFALEGMGFCKQGEGAAFVADGMLDLDGRWPTNTNGGQLSEGYMQGWGLLAEAVRQLRHECGTRQIPDASAIQYICASGITSSIIFRR